MGKSKLTGAWGEALAAEYLRKKRYAFICHRQRHTAFSSNVHKSLLISCPAAGIILTRYVTLSKVGVTMNSVGLLLPIIIILAVVAALVISWFVAGEFFRIAEDKGYHERKYFWISFLLGFVGYLLIAAMPDRSVGQSVVSNDELPDL